MRQEPAIAQTALGDGVVLRLWCASAILRFCLDAAGLGVCCAAVLLGEAVDAEEVLDLLACRVVDLGIAVQSEAGELSFLGGGVVRHVGGGALGRERCRRFVSWSTFDYVMRIPEGSSCRWMC